MSTAPRGHSAYWLLLIATLVVVVVYWPGLCGGWVFDDYPNIVDNPGVQPHQPTIPALVGAALSSPASDFKRPLASLSFAANYLVSGLDPWAWKLTNLIFHLINGTLVFLLARALLSHCAGQSLDKPLKEARSETKIDTSEPAVTRPDSELTDRVAVLIAAAWMLLPINLTAVLYVVQREESIANLFVLLGLIGYLTGRQQMLVRPSPSLSNDGMQWRGFAVCATSLILATAVGLLAKETAVMLPLYALLTEWIAFQFQRYTASGTRKDWRIVTLFIGVLLLPMVLGIAWLMPTVLDPANWASRDFNLHMRLLSEARIVCDYIAWALLPTPGALSFYHDQFSASTGLFSPLSTLASILVLACLTLLIYRLRQRQPLVALGIGLYLSCHLLTGTILPLELVYEHRNYFASFGILLAVIPLLSAIPVARVQTKQPRHDPSLALARKVLLACLLLWWAGLTAITAWAWGEPLRLAQDLAARAPDSPRAQYELGRTYIIYSHYDPASPYTQLAYAPLEIAATLPNSSILPQQALIFMNSRMQLPVKDTWWTSMINKLRSTKPTVEDESSLQALMQCLRDQACKFSTERLDSAFRAALSHPNPSARLLSMYGDYAWNVLNDRALGLRMTELASQNNPGETAYHITLARMLIAEGRLEQARQQVTYMQKLNIGNRLGHNIRELDEEIRNQQSN